MVNAKAFLECLVVSSIVLGSVNIYYQRLTKKHDFKYRNFCDTLLFSLILANLFLVLVVSTIVLADSLLIK